MQGVIAFSILRDIQLKEVEKNSKQRARELRQCLTELGPAFVKLGQVSPVAAKLNAVLPTCPSTCRITQCAGLSFAIGKTLLT